ncbi:hypothetical protein T484DRAFT_1806434 [Baffinella frigidus]|nr:hypothetical protein T484DRAFT_1806434 [Cryptophyta sp. CCMP2293]
MVPGAVPIPGCVGSTRLPPPLSPYGTNMALGRAAHRALAPLAVLALLLSLTPVGGEEDGAAAGERIRAWRAALRVAEWRDLHYLAGFRSPHEWLRDPENCTHSSSFGPGVEYIPGCAHGYRYSAVEVTSAPALCAELAAHGVRKVTMVGDSFMRHLYVAFVTLLRGDWAAGSLIANHFPECEHRGQYSEKVCRSQIKSGWSWLSFHQD